MNYFVKTSSVASAFDTRQRLVASSRITDPSIPCRQKRRGGEEELGRVTLFAKFILGIKPREGDSGESGQLLASRRYESG